MLCGGGGGHGDAVPTNKERLKGTRTQSGGVVFEVFSFFLEFTEERKKNGYGI